MLVLASSHGSPGLGIVLIAIGLLHLIFRRFYARRAKAIHDARQDTAAGVTKRFYRRHDSSFYLIGEWVLGIAFIVIGLILAIANS